jgi:hypothetical protein
LLVIDLDSVGNGVEYNFFVFFNKTVQRAARDTEDEEEEKMFDVRSVNKDLDIDSKIAALKVSLSVVCLLSRTGINE